MHDYIDTTTFLSGSQSYIYIIEIVLISGHLQCMHITIRTSCITIIYFESHLFRKHKLRASSIWKCSSFYLRVQWRRHICNNTDMSQDIPMYQSPVLAIRLWAVLHTMTLENTSRKSPIIILRLMLINKCFA